MAEKQKVANPAPLGLLGFGVTTILLNFVHNYRLSPSVDPMILGMGIFYGGIAQVIAGVLEYKKGNTFGTVAFSSYGFFWLSYVFLSMVPNTSFFTGYSAPTGESFAAYFFMWGLFTLIMFFGTLKTNRALQVVFMSLAVLFFLLSLRFALLAFTPYTTTDLATFTSIIGLEGIFTGFSAFYLGLAEILNEVHGKTVLPIGQLI
jgi:succinate-acetate transporter protein